MVAIGPETLSVQPFSDLHIGVCSSGVPFKHLNDYWSFVGVGHTHFTYSNKLTYIPLWDGVVVVSLQRAFKFTLIRFF
jgi:hypothetical protein